MPRKPDPKSPFKVSIHVSNGYRYASTQPGKLNPKTQKIEYRHVHWGSLTEANVFVPGTAYYEASPEERAKLIFPEDWNISRTEHLFDGKDSCRTDVENQDENLLFGDMWLLYEIAKKQGVYEHLLKIFEGDKEIVDAILTLACYLLVQQGTYNRLESWQKITWCPYQYPLSSPDITRLTQSITAQHRMDFLRLRKTKITDKAFCAVDSTSRSAWGDSLADIRYGKNKDHLPLPQTLEVVVYTLTDHMPIYYQTFQGNTPDSRSLKAILNDLESIGLGNIILITDRGYETLENLEMLIEKKQAFITAAKIDQSFILSKIRNFGIFSHSPDEMEVDPETKIYFKQYGLKDEFKSICSKNADTSSLNLNLFFNPEQRCRDITSIDVEITKQRRALEELVKSNEPIGKDPSAPKAYSYFKLEFDKESFALTKYELKTQKIEKERLIAGFFANITNQYECIPMESYKHYKMRDEQEKYFSMMKGVLGADRQRNWSEQGKSGRLFILFVAQILGSYLTDIRKTKLKDSFDSFSSVLDEMRPIRYIKHPKMKEFITPFIGKQVEICNACNISIPEGCAPSPGRKSKIRKPRHFTKSKAPKSDSSKEE